MQLWCTINKQYTSIRLWAKYIWLWLALFVSIGFYIPLSLWAIGNLTIDPNSWWKFSIQRVKSDSN